MSETISDTMVVAKTIYGEARGDDIRGMLAVACVIRNRVQHPRIRWWGTGWKGVCLAPFQFSCWNDNDPNRKLLNAIPEFGDWRKFPGFVNAKAIARDFVDPPSVPDEHWPDITRGADHYHSVEADPDWAEGRKAVAMFGKHIFYRLH